MARQHADPRHASCCQLAAGNGQAELVVGSRPDRNPVLVSSVKAVEAQQLALPLVLVVGQRVGEDDVRRLHRRAQIISGRGANLDRHEMRSSGA